ncbi:hypothetical protein MB27_19110 [Actinoplanes utahensis]|uniref:Uncharacterized protein n=1 Tax=Actinoplanes utahensis TaxID=1869 RepID=A0A0A6X786_ACTUT|nr:hypothetical protein MB27_19110 [Actinoplanes utahensis]
MGVGDVGVAVDDVAGVGGVLQEAADGHAGPFLAGAVGDAAPVEFVGYGAGAEAFLHVHADDFAEDRGLVLVWYEFLGCSVDEVAVGAVAAGPFSFGGFGVHSVDDAVDDGFAFEFGKDAEELDEHAPDGGGGVERFGGRGERDARVFELSE